MLRRQPLHRGGGTRLLQPLPRLDESHLFVFYKVRDVARVPHVAHVHAVRLARFQYLVRHAAILYYPDERRVAVLRVPRLRGLPVAHEIPRVSGLVFDVVEIRDGDAVLLALGQVLVHVAPDAELGEADEEHARAEDDGARGRALGRGEAEVAARGGEVGDDVTRRRVTMTTRGPRRDAARRCARRDAEARRERGVGAAREARRGRRGGRERGGHRSRERGVRARGRSVCERTTRACQLDRLLSSSSAPDRRTLAQTDEEVPVLVPPLLLRRHRGRLPSAFVRSRRDSAPRRATTATTPPSEPMRA